MFHPGIIVLYVFGGNLNLASSTLVFVRPLLVWEPLPRTWLAGPLAGWSRLFSVLISALFPLCTPHRGMKPSLPPPPPSPPSPPLYHPGITLSCFALFYYLVFLACFLDLAESPKKAHRKEGAPQLRSVEQKEGIHQKQSDFQGNPAQRAAGSMRPQHEPSSVPRLVARCGTRAAPRRPVVV